VKREREARIAQQCIYTALLKAVTESLCFKVRGGEVGAFILP
jgi:hypothetical protein